MRLSKTLSVASAVCAILLSGCSIVDSSPTHKSSGVRHDLAPLRERLKEIGRPAAATWIMRSTCPANNDRILPGPCDYYLGAIIELDPAVAQSLRTKYLIGGATYDPMNLDLDSDDQPSNHALVEKPKLPPELEAKLPAGEYAFSEGLQEALSSGPSRPYLHTTRPILVIA